MSLFIITKSPLPDAPTSNCSISKALPLKQPESILASLPAHSHVHPLLQKPLNHSNPLFYFASSLWICLASHSSTTAAHRPSCATNTKLTPNTLLLVVFASAHCIFLMPRNPFPLKKTSSPSQPSDITSSRAKPFLSLCYTLHTSPQPHLPPLVTRPRSHSHYGTVWGWAPGMFGSRAKPFLLCCPGRKGENFAYCLPKAARMWVIYIKWF